MTDKKYNVLFLSSWYPNRLAPTLGNFVQKHAEAVALQSNVIVIFVCADDSCKRKYEVEESFINHVHAINVYYKKVNHKIPLLAPLQKLILYFKAHFIAIKKIPEGFKADIVHQNILFPSGIIALYLKMIKGIPYIATEHSTIYLNTTTRKIGFVQKLIAKAIAKNAAYVTTVSDNLMNEMIKGGFKARYKSVYNVVDTSLFKSVEISPETKKIRFLHISTLDDKHKNISGMLRVISKLAGSRNDFEFFFISDGDLKPHIKTAAALELLSSVVFFEGTKSTDGIAASMQKANCFVLFSNYENLPCVIIEALASGLPVISTNVGGISEHITEQFGILIEAGNEDALFISLNAMIENIKEKKYNARQLHSYAEKKFSYEHVSKTFHEIYQSVLGDV